MISRFCRQFRAGLSRLTTDEKLREAFSPFGRLLEGKFRLLLAVIVIIMRRNLGGNAAKVIMDRETGRSKGFGFVTYASAEEASGAREGMNAKFLDGWVIFVDPAKPRELRIRSRSTSSPESSRDSGRRY